MATARPARPAGKPRTRKPAHPARKRLILAVVLVLLGSFLPWIYTAMGSLSGIRGAGLWTFTAAMLGLAGALLPLRRIGALQAAIMSATCVVLAVWQLGRAIVRLPGFGDAWMPGPGLVLVLGGGVLAGVAAVQLYRIPGPAES